MAEESLYKVSLSKAMALCSKREYCPEDIRVKIISWGLGEDEAVKAIRALMTENFLNEKRYAEAFVKDKFNYNKWGKVKIASHLRMKKIPAAIISSALSLIDDESYRKAAAGLLSSHRRSIKARNQYELKGKLLRFGLSRGFETDLLYGILNDSAES